MMALCQQQIDALSPFNAEEFARVLYMKSISSADNLCFDDVKIDLIEAVSTAYEAGRRDGPRVETAAGGLPNFR